MRRRDAVWCGATMAAQNAQQLSADDVRTLAAGLLRAFETGVPVEPLTVGHPELSVDDAYRIQRELLATHESAGRRVIGRKIGLTSRAIQEQLGIGSPDFGAILQTHTFGPGATISRGGYRMVLPRIEPEVALVLDRDLRGPGTTSDDVRRSTMAVHPVLEIIDSRIRDWRIGLVDTVADNASCFGVVLGPPALPADLGPLAALRVELLRDDIVVQSGTGAAVLGDPSESVAWLANELGRRGDVLPAGEPILAGSFTAAVDLEPGLYEARFGGSLGSVTVTAEA